MIGGGLAADWWRVVKERDAALDRVARMRSILSELIWIESGGFDGLPTYWTCWGCDFHKPHHSEHCEMAALIAEEPDPS